MSDSPASPFESAFESALATYLLARGWRRDRCGDCGRGYFGKGAGGCGSPWCPGSRTAAPAGADGQEPVRRPLPAQWQRIRAALARRGLAPSAVADLSGAARDTDLVVSALQSLDAVVHQGAPAPDGIRILAQPCVRWRYLPAAGREEGVSSSFINLSSLEVGGTDLIDRVSEHLDCWLDVLSAVGLHARHITVALTDETCDYGPYRGRRADVNCGGVELGEINWYHDVADVAGRRLTVIDCGFAFERIAWSAARPEPYHRVLSPYYLDFPGRVEEGAVVNDRARTLALLSLSGIRPGSRGARRYARQLAGELAVPFLRGASTRGFLEHATLYWRQFVAPAGSGQDAVGIASEAIERQAVARLAGALRQAVPPDHLAFSEAADFLAGRSGGRGAVSRAVETLVA
ncbi:hypothetical protein [Streptomyces sp. NBC_01190]|uniref:hypothetical protein n=1 Tax=Streptomyces sp. NBC_01190 TaxID=2903767 RepID=UPI00386FB01A|nr:hypothetical protein OG519_24205 [Streptomyces sp. NBC_01190]